MQESMANGLVLIVGAGPTGLVLALWLTKLGVRVRIIDKTADGASSTVREQLAIGFPGGTYTGLFYVADVEAAGPATDGELHVDLEEADFVLVFPLKKEGRVRLVGSPGRRPATLGRDRNGSG